MNQNEFDQQMASLRDGLPSVWWALYDGCLNKGFSADQSMQLLIAFIQKPEAKIQ